MARQATAKIVAWGTPPEPKPTGWDAVRLELIAKPGEWANVGEFSSGSARKVANDRVPASQGFETRIVPSEATEGRMDLWVRYTDGTANADAEASAPDASAESATPRKTVKRGGVV